MSYGTSRRRLLAAIALLSAAAGGSRAQAQQAFPQDDTRPEGVPADVTQEVIKDVGSWRVVSIANNSQAFIPPEHVRVERDGIRETRGGNDVLIGGSGEIKLEYRSNDSAFSGNLFLRTTSNELMGTSAEVFVDGVARRTVKLTDVAAVDLTELFGPDLAGLAAAKTISATMDVQGKTFTIYEVELVGTADALKQMRLIPDYNWNVRGLGRPGPQQDANPQPGQCFLTTACCGRIGLADDCFELAALRRFRDEVMLKSEAGRREVRLYYAVAPLVLAAMRRRGEETRLTALYFGTILPCALAARLGLVRLPLHLYRRMMRSLVARYRIEATLPVGEV